jgi:hypothetical protein
MNYCKQVITLMNSSVKNPIKSAMCLETHKWKKELSLCYVSKSNVFDDV